MSEKNSEDVLGKLFHKYLSGYTISQALLEDYAEVVSKIEGVDSNIIRERVTKRANEIRKEFVDTLPPKE